MTCPKSKECVCVCVRLNDHHCSLSHVYPGQELLPDCARKHAFGIAVVIWKQGSRAYNADLRSRVCNTPSLRGILSNQRRQLPFGSHLTKRKRRRRKTSLNVIERGGDKVVRLCGC